MPCEPCFLCEQAALGKDQGDEASCREHCRTVGSWPLLCLPWAGPPSVRNLAERAEMRSGSHFFHIPWFYLRIYLVILAAAPTEREDTLSLLGCGRSERGWLPLPSITPWALFLTPQGLLYFTNPCATDLFVSGE